MQDVARRCRPECYGPLAQRSPVSRSTIRRFLDLTPPDCLRIFDINLRQHFYDRPVIEESLRRARILKINDEELDIIGPLLDYAAAAPSDVCRRLIADYGLDMVVLTCGVNGSYVFTSSEDFFRPTPQVRVADTVGAGDSFTGAFCAALLGGRSVDEAHALAVEVSAYVCTQHGAMPPLPEEMKSRACRV
jgi:fructokinase